MRIIIFSLLVVAGAVMAFLFTRGGSATAAEAGGGGTLVSGERAAAIAVNCANCHGTSGRLQTEIPAIAGKPAAVLQAQLLAFKRDEIPGATVMPRLAKGYSDAELEAVARYFASISPEID